MRKSAFFLLPMRANRAKAAESTRSPRDAQEGGAVPIGTACTPHPPCVIPPRQTLHGGRIPYAPSTPS